MAAPVPDRAEVTVEEKALTVLILPRAAYVRALAHARERRGE